MNVKGAGLKQYLTHGDKMKNKDKTKILGAIVALLIVIGAVLVLLPDQDATGHTVNARPIKIGLAVPLTGEVAGFGEGVLTGVELAVKEINAKGGVSGRKIVIVAEDTMCDESSGATALTKLVTVDRVDGLIGPLCSGAAGAGLPVVVQYNVPTVMIASAPQLTSLGENIFRVYPSDTFEGSASAELMIAEDASSVAVLYVQNDWGVGIHDVFVDSFESLDGDVVMSIGVSPEIVDVRTELLKMMRAGPDVLYVVGYPDLSSSFVRQAKELGWNGLIVGTPAGFEIESSLMNPASEGVIYVASRMSNGKEFADRVEVYTGKKSEFFTPLAYDATQVLGLAMSEGVGSSKVIANLRETAHQGEAFELISFDSVGDLQTADFDVKVIRDGEGVVV